MTLSRQSTRTRPRETLAAAFLLAVSLAWLGCGGDSSSSAPGASRVTLIQTPLPRGTQTAPAVHGSYRAELEAFSPTLGRLFANGRMVILPGYAPAPGLDASLATNYAFSAVDGFGRVYHFFQSSRWLMSNVRALAHELPSDGWRAAWNPAHRTLELLCTSSYAGGESASVLRLADDRWELIPTEQAPKAAVDALSAFDPSSNSWFVISRGEGTAAGLLRLNDRRWESIPSAVGPDFSQTRRLIAYPPQSGLALLTATGEVWLWSQGNWSLEATLTPDDYSIFHFNPATGKILVGASKGIGRTKLWKVSLSRGSTQLDVQEKTVTRSDLVMINEETEGVWNGVGRIVGPQTESDGGDETFVPGLRGLGDPGLSIEKPTGGAFWRADEIDTIEFPPQFDSFLPDRGEYVPALGGFVEVSDRPSGEETLTGVRFPFVAVADEMSTDVLALEPRSTVRRRHSRFWVFEAEKVDWLKPFPETHPDLDFQYQRIHPQSKVQELLSWNYPEEGVLHYRYRRRAASNVQWEDSPPLTLRDLPGVPWKPGDKFWMLDTVLSGEPASVVQAGWVGTLDRENPDQPRAVPAYGFLARTSALSPEDWTSQELPIQFTADCKLLSNPAGEELFLLGGRTAVKVGGGREAHFQMIPNQEIWRWSRGSWERVDAEGTPQPSLDTPFAAAFDPISAQIFVLDRREFWTLQGSRWKRLGEGLGSAASTARSSLWIHPLTGQILGGSLSDLSFSIAVWENAGWAAVQPPRDSPHGAWPLNLTSESQLLPSTSSPDYYAIQRDDEATTASSINSGYAFALRLMPEAVSIAR